MSNTYGFSTYAGEDFDHAIDIVTKELKKHGFGIVTDIDLQAIFKEKLAVDDHRYRIIGVCNPWVAHEALRIDPDMGLLLPCNIVVREGKDGAVTISFTAPEAILGLVCRTDVVRLGLEVRRRLEKVRDAVANEINHSVA
jgi:uncharacterized protein (DUF302 family)